MLNEKEFYNYVKENIKDVMNEEFQSNKLELHSVMKENGNELTGLMVNQGVVSPIVYLNQSYKDYLNGVTMNQIFESIIESINDSNVQDNRNAKEFADKLTDFDFVKNLIFPKLIDPALNKSLDSEYIKKHIEDYNMDIIYQIEKDCFRYKVKKQILDIWGIDEIKLYKIAMKNLEVKTRDAFLCNLDKYMMTKLFGDDDSKLIKNNLLVSNNPIKEQGFYMLSNMSLTNGSDLILNKKLLKKIANKLEESFYIIPSSIHEIIIIPEKEKTLEKNKTFLDMVKDVNDKDVQPEDLLSYKIWFYNLNEKVIEVIEE